MNLDRLPYLPARLARKLPPVQAIYFVILRESVLYVGSATNLRARWSRHERKPSALESGAFIAWLEHGEKSTLLATEAAFIKQLRPAWNRCAGRPRKDDAKDLHLKFNGEIYRQIDAFSELHGMTVTTALEMAAELLLKRGRPVAPRKPKQPTP